MLSERWSSEPRLTPKGGLTSGEAMRVAAGSAALRKIPDGSAEQVNQALFGEPVRVLERETDKDGSEWAYVQLGIDRYVGWMRMASLGPAGEEPTHRVRVLRSFIYERADMKSRPSRAVSMNARMALGETVGNFVEIRGSGWIFARHIAPLDDPETDFVDVAQRFVGSPYLWGGRESAGIDCSGVVQVALQATGVYPLRDSDMQEQTLGLEFKPAPDFSDMERGDLVFWRGHVGIMCSPTMLLHSSARDMHCEIEPLGQAVDRIRPIAGDVRSVRRFG
ncbi:MAG TPA: NlpC/P60 family protein [Hyphomonadaceae bacterium]|jgi:cell wall-associated NlpC family hydrolase|nr:NlpC/P60 family protein [Hyphomonadaceae bacterium]HPN06039.1 NlpC/P60 family protein [Hyphomonadaceae bacterium]